MLFFPWPGDPPASPCSHGGLATAREKSLRLRRKLFSLDPAVDMKPPGYSIVPEGLRSLARSPPADRARNIVPSVFSVSPWLVNKSAYRNLVSTVCGAKGIGVSIIRSFSFAVTNGHLIYCLTHELADGYFLRTFLLR